MPEEQKKERGITSTPAEILQQPQMWKQTYEIINEKIDLDSHMFDVVIGYHKNQRVFISCHDDNVSIQAIYCDLTIGDGPKKTIQVK